MTGFVAGVDCGQSVIFLDQVGAGSVRTAWFGSWISSLMSWICTVSVACALPQPGLDGAAITPRFCSGCSTEGA